MRQRQNLLLFSLILAKRQATADAYYLKPVGSDGAFYRGSPK